MELTRSRYMFTAVHLHDSGLASARSCARILLDPMLAGCTMTVHVCGPIGNGRGSEACLFARFHMHADNSSAYPVRVVQIV